MTSNETLDSGLLDKRHIIAKAGGSNDPFLEEFFRKMKPEDRAQAENKAKEGVVRVVFHSADAAATQEGAVRAAVSDICRAA